MIFQTPKPDREKIISIFLNFGASWWTLIAKAFVVSTNKKFINQNFSRILKNFEENFTNLKCLIEIWKLPEKALNGTHRAGYFYSYGDNGWLRIGGRRGNLRYI